MATGRPTLRTALPYLTAKPREEIALERGLLTGIAAFRWASWVWMAVVVAYDTTRQDPIARPGTAIAFVVAAFVWTGVASVLVRTNPSALLEPWALAVELVLSLAMVFADWWVYGPTSIHSQSLGSVWPVAVVLTIGIAYAGRAGFAAGLILGITRLLGQLRFGYDNGMGDGDNQQAAVGTIVLYALAGAVAGFVTIRLREAEREIATARAREEVARTLHDGVLQTLAIVQRRAADDDLVALAREQEQELRQFLFNPRPDPRRLFRPATADLATALRAAAAEAERRHGLRTQVVLTDDLAPVPDEVADALAGAVGEAMNNAAKHGHARKVTIFLEPADTGGVFCSVKDDGQGFDPGAVDEGIGVTKSIRGRVAEIGGTVEIDGRPGRGTEVRFHIP